MKEKFEPERFWDITQYNIGYGTAARGRKSITEPEARAEMRQELERHAAAIDRKFPNLPKHMRDPLISLSFNTGGRWYEHDTNPDGSPTLAGLLKQGQYDEARERFKQYTKAGGKELRGLKIRREQEAHMFTDPGYIRSGKGTSAVEDWGGKMEPRAASAAAVTTPAGRPGFTADTAGSKWTGGKSMAGVDPRLIEAMRAASGSLPSGYTLRSTSGFRRGDPRFHGRGMASDWQIIDPSGRPIPNRGEDTTGLYGRLARVAYGHLLKNHPDLAKRFAWGGTFAIPGKPRTADIMHYDIGGERGRLHPELHPQRMGPLYPEAEPHKSHIETLRTKPAEPDVDREAIEPEPMRKERKAERQEPERKAERQEPERKAEREPEHTEKPAPKEDVKAQPKPEPKEGKDKEAKKEEK